MNKTVVRNVVLSHRVVRNVVLSHRVARRFCAKSTAKLMVEYKDALDDLKNGKVDKMVAFARQTFETLFPEGKMPSWAYALSSVKKNQVRSLFRELQIFQLNAQGAEANETLLHGAQLMAGGWGKVLKTIEVVTHAEDEKEFSHGPFKVVPMPGLTKAQMSGALEALDEATSKIRQHFPGVLYGNVYFSTALKRGIAGMYVPSEDKFYLNVSAQKRFHDVYTIIHELGHRYDFKFLDKDLKRQFWDLSTRKVYEKVTFDGKLREQVADEVVQLAKDRAAGKQSLKMSDELVMWLKGPHIKGDPRKLTSDYLNGKIDDKQLHDAIRGTKDVEMQTDKLLHGPLSVTTYGATSPTENFAEAFAHYVLGMKMPQEFIEILSDAK